MQINFTGLQAPFTQVIEVGPSSLSYPLAHSTNATELSGKLFFSMDSEDKTIVPFKTGKEHSVTTTTIKDVSQKSQNY